MPVEKDQGVFVWMVLKPQEELISLMEGLSTLMEFGIGSGSSSPNWLEGLSRSPCSQRSTQLDCSRVTMWWPGIHPVHPWDHPK